MGQLLAGGVLRGLVGREDEWGYKIRESRSALVYPKYTNP